MKTTLLRSAAALLTIGLCAGAMALPTAATTSVAQEDNVYLCDEGYLLTDSEFSAVLSELQDTADQTGMNIGVWIGTTEVGDGSDADTVAFCDDQYDELYGINTDGVFLYLDMSGASHLYDYISTSGKGQFYYTNSSSSDRVSEIFSCMNPYLVRGSEDIPGALHQFCYNLEYYAEKGAPSDTYYTYNEDSGKYLIMQNGVVKEVSELPEEYTAKLSWGMIILIAIAGALIAFGLSLLIIRSSYQFKTAGNMRNYLEAGKIRHKRNTDQFLRTYRTRT
ncbi:hypothetical protein, partial [Ruminococcus sp.]